MKFCTRCVAPVEAAKEPRRKLFCELAYTGTLFWLPLLTCPDQKIEF